MTRAQLEYRVVWKRVGHRRKTKRFARLATAEKFLVMLGPEPWRAYAFHRDGRPKDPEDVVCCGGWECGCGGQTVREQSDEMRKNMGPLEGIPVLECREVGPWRAGASLRGLGGGTPQ